MKLTYNTKYKDRDPEETIALVQKFFKDNGLTIKQSMLRRESSSTWTASLAAYYYDIPVATSNGKGTSEKFCLASAHAELYERFCNKIFSFMNPILYNRVIKKSQEINGFSFSPEEKELTFEEAFDTNAGRTFLSCMQDHPNDLKIMLSKIFDNRFIGVPFKNLESDEVKYVDPRVLTYLHSSTGMAAGNTLYEAINQGMSEIYEHYVLFHTFLNQDHTYFLTDKAIRVNESINSIIDKISEKNDLYIVDCSYSYNVPVLMSIIVNKKTHTATYNLGSSPIFEIALERVLTELYQGTYDFDDLKLNGQMPFRGSYDANFVDYVWPGTTITKMIFPEEILLKGEWVDEYNKDIFISGSYSNEEIYESILKINKKNGFNVFIYDCSLSKDIYAIRLFETTTPIFEADPSFAKSIPNKITYISYVINIYNFIESYLANKQINMKLVNNIIAVNENIKKSQEVKAYVDKLFGLENWFLMGSGRGDCISIFDLIERILYHPECLVNKNSDLLGFLSGTSGVIYDPLIRYTILLRYINKIDLYTSDELNTIFNFLNLNVSQEDLDHLEDKEYHIRNICLRDINSLANGKYNEYIELLAKLHWAK